MNSLQTQIEEYLNYNRGLETLSNKTLIAYHHDLCNRFLPYAQKKNINSASDVTQDIIEKFLVEVKNNGHNGSTANITRKLNSLKSLFKYLVKKNQVKINPCDEVPIPKNPSRTISYLTEEEQTKLLQTVQEEATPFYKDRDLAILRLFLGTGMRVSELVGLKIQDFEVRPRGVSYVRIKRKGGNEVTLPICPKVTTSIKTYLDKRIEENGSEYVFLSKKGGPIKSNTVYSLVKHYLKLAGIEKKKWGPHILRHTVGVTLRRRGVDIATIQHLLGHKKLETTAIYLNVEPQDLEKAVQLLL